MVKRRLTLEDRRVVREFINGVVDGCVVEKDVERKTMALAKRPTTQVAMREALEHAGLTEEVIAKNLAELTGANRTQYFSSWGRVTESRTDPDHMARLKANELVIKLMGVESPKQIDLNVSGGMELNTRIGEMDDDELTRLLESCLTVLNEDGDGEGYSGIG